MAVNAVKEALETKYPGKKKSVTRIIGNNAVQKALLAHPLENAEVPTLEELVAVGKACGADRCCLSACCRCAKRKPALWLL